MGAGEDTNDESRGKNEINSRNSYNEEFDPGSG